MKRIVLFCCLMISHGVFAMHRSVLPPAPERVEYVKEILVKFNHEVVGLFNGLSDVEKAFVAMVYQASIPWYSFATDQIHRSSQDVIDILHDIIKHQEVIKIAWGSGDLELEGVANIEDFIAQIRTLLMYVFSNNGIYFIKEHADSKRTPARLGLSLITPNNLEAALCCVPRDRCSVMTFIAQHEGMFIDSMWQDLLGFIFDATIEPTLTTDGSIANSAVNIYGPKGFSAGDPRNFTDDDYKQFLAMNARHNPLINYYSVDYNEETGNRAIVAQSFHERYKESLKISIGYLSMAMRLADDHREYFDEHMVACLGHLINFLKTGDESSYDLYSIVWLKSKSRVGIEMGWTEVYYDPMGNVGFPQAEVTIADPEAGLDAIISMLPSMEEQLPLPPEFKRDVLGSSAAFPNAQVRRQVFGIGGLGPLSSTAAYCLPNKSEIRSQYGTRQVIYPPGKNIQRQVNNDLTNQLFFLPERAAWLAEYDPEASILQKLWYVHVVLHETLGHGSGRVDKHTFVAEDDLTVNGVTYAVGDQIQITEKNSSHFLRGYGSALEEMRAEIIALYTSLVHLDQIKACKLLGDWGDRLSDTQLQEWLIFDMANTALHRMIQQSDAATEITGAHALANCTITNYLVERGGIAYEVAPVDINGVMHDVVGIKIVDLGLSIASVTELMQEVQRIKSTADGVAVERLINTFGKPLNREFMAILKAHQKTISGDLKATVVIPPHLEPKLGNDGKWAVQASWPEDCIDLLNRWTLQDFNSFDDGE